MKLIGHIICYFKSITWLKYFSTIPHIHVHATHIHTSKIKNTIINFTHFTSFFFLVCEILFYPITQFSLVCDDMWIQKNQLLHCMKASCAIAERQSNSLSKIKPVAIGVYTSERESTKHYQHFNVFCEALFFYISEILWLQLSYVMQLSKECRICWCCLFIEWFKSVWFYTVITCYAHDFVYSVACA